jgi:hypothetical protein
MVTVLPLGQACDDDTIIVEHTSLLWHVKGIMLEQKRVCVCVCVCVCGMEVAENRSASSHQEPSWYVKQDKSVGRNLPDEPTNNYRLGHFWREPACRGAASCILPTCCCEPQDVATLPHALMFRLCPAVSGLSMVQHTCSSSAFVTGVTASLDMPWPN